MVLFILIAVGGGGEGSVMGICIEKKIQEWVNLAKTCFHCQES